MPARRSRQGGSRRRKPVVVESSSSEEESESEESSSEEESDDDGDSDDSSEEESSDEDGYERDEENALDTLIDSVGDYDDPKECWDLVREWLREHSVEETQAAIEYKGEFDTTALHVACRNHPPRDVVDVMLMAHPDGIFWADSFGWLPLHYATANGTDIEVVNLLLDAYPDSRLTTDKRGRTPLHFALGNVDNPPTPQLVKLLAGKTGESAKWPDENKMLPIHYACAYGASVEVLEELVQAWEESIGKPDGKGRLPIHFALGNADRPNSAPVAQLLVSLSPGCIDIHDSEKNLPLHLLSAKAAGVEVSKFMERENIKKCLNVYLKAKPKQSIDFLTGIQNMPVYIRDVAVIHPTVQTMLNAKISSRFPTMILMLDFYFLAAIIGTFSFTSRQALERRFDPLNNVEGAAPDARNVSGALLSPLFIGSVYFFFREVTQMISVRQQTTVIKYLTEPENALNLSFVFLNMYYTILMSTGAGDDNSFRTGCAFTLGVSYLQVLAYLKSILIEFAVFVSGVVYVTTRLVAFMVSLIITIVAFAQMWYTIFRQSSECLSAFGEDDVGTPAPTPSDDMFPFDEPEPEAVEDCEPSVDYPFCTSLSYSIYKTYTMMLGEIDDSIFMWSLLSLILFCIFFFAEVVILLNILIAIICDLYGVITNDRAAIVFWSNRLAFITDMDMVTNGPWKKTVMNFFKLNDGDDEEEEDAPLMKKEDKVEISWERIVWTKLIDCFDPEVDSAGHMGMILYVPLRIFISMFLIPFWLLLGVLSAGWLWAPQVREGLFVQKVSVPEDTYRRTEGDTDAN
mmetsp:Transcript_36082/g.85994  ORF Transcript_36082/g.85994 Transcript_36082/m.85994 type:complete len:799 (+) Transcript_36082:146-2542(+)